MYVCWLPLSPPPRLDRPAYPTAADKKERFVEKRNGKWKHPAGHAVLIARVAVYVCLGGLTIGLLVFSATS